MTDNKDLFLITGATGNTGAHTVRLLRERGLRVRALVHTLDDRAAGLRELGAEVVQGDLLDFPSLSAATSGVTAAYFNYPVAPGLVEATANFVQAASEAGVHAVVNMSQISARREATSNAARHHWLAERLLDRSALVTTHLRPTFFTFFLNMFWIRDTDEGIYRMPFADGRFAPVDAADQALSSRPSCRTPIRMIARSTRWSAPKNSTGMKSQRKSKQPWVSRCATSRSIFPRSLPT
jgi:uncharacterized protein YbjT (DUF2867 family)